MGQAPASGQNSLRTVPRNFPGRSGTKEDSVFLCSPETAAASALTGTITDPRQLEERYDMSYPSLDLGVPPQPINTEMLVPPPEDGRDVELVKGPNISSLPDFDEVPDDLELQVLLKVGDNISTDEIMPAGQRVLPYRSNIPKISEFVYYQIDEDYPAKAIKLRDSSDGHMVVGGNNYGQGSSREHAAIAPRYLGLRVLLAKSFARIHWQNLANFGIVALEFDDESDYDAIEQGDVLRFSGLREGLTSADRTVVGDNTTKDRRYRLRHSLSGRQVDMLLAGGLIPVFRQRLGST